MFSKNMILSCLGFEKITGMNCTSTPLSSRLPILCSRSLALATPNAIHIRNQDVGGAFELLHQLVPILTDILIFNRFQ